MPSSGSEALPVTAAKQSLKRPQLWRHPRKNSDHKLPIFFNRN